MPRDLELSTEILTQAIVLRLLYVGVFFRVVECLLGIFEHTKFNEKKELTKMEENNPTPQDLQRKLYFLVEQLQNMASSLPPKYQMRLPYELLSALANSLLNDTIFEIVKGLMEIQHVTEKHLFQQRLQLLNKQKIETQETLMNFTSEEDKLTAKIALQVKHKAELKQNDMKLVMQLDQKVADQQGILEKAGVPGFYVTDNPMEIQVQMRLCDFIIRLSKMEIPT